MGVFIGVKGHVLYSKGIEWVKNAFQTVTECSILWWMSVRCTIGQWLKVAGEMFGQYARIDFGQQMFGVVPC
jgi:hypothetical protein